MSPKKVAPTQPYISRADLMKQVQQLTRTLKKQREALQAMRVAQVEPDEPEEPAGDDLALPDVPDDGIPSSFRAGAANGSRRTAPAAAPNRAAERFVREIRQTFLGNNPDGTITIHPSAYVRSLFAQRRRGLGGFQSLHNALQNRMGGTRELTLTAADFRRIVNYAVNYGEGGFQQSLRWLVAQAVAETLQVAKPAQQ